MTIIQDQPEDVRQALHATLQQSTQANNNFLTAALAMAKLFMSKIEQVEAEGKTVEQVLAEEGKLPLTPEEKAVLDLGKAIFDEQGETAKALNAKVVQQCEAFLNPQ